MKNGCKMKERSSWDVLDCLLLLLLLRLRLVVISCEERRIPVLVEVLGRMTVRVSYDVLQILVAIECGDRIARAYRATNDDVAIE